MPEKLNFLLPGLRMTRKIVMETLRNIGVVM